MYDQDEQLEEVLADKSAIKAGEPPATDVHDKEAVARAAKLAVKRDADELSREVDPKQDQAAEDWVKLMYKAIPSLKCEQAAACAAQAHEYKDTQKLSDKTKAHLLLVAAAAHVREREQRVLWNKLPPAYGAVDEVLGAVALAPDDQSSVVVFSRTILAFSSHAKSAKMFNLDLTVQPQQAIELLAKWPDDALCLVVRLRLATFWHAGEIAKQCSDRLDRMRTEQPGKAEQAERDVDSDAKKAAKESKDIKQ